MGVRKILFLLTLLMVACGKVEQDGFIPDKKNDITYHTFSDCNPNREIQLADFTTIMKDNFLKDNSYKNVKVTLNSKKSFYNTYERYAQNMQIQNDKKISFFTNILYNKTDLLNTRLFGRSVGIDFRFLDKNCEPVSLLFGSSKSLVDLVQDEPISSWDEIKCYEHKISFQNSYNYVEYSFSSDYSLSSAIIKTYEDDYRVSFSYFNEEDCANFRDNVSYELFLANIYSKANQNTAIKNVTIKASLDIVEVFHPARWDEPARIETFDNPHVMVESRISGEYEVPDTIIGNYGTTNLRINRYYSTYIGVYDANGIVITLLGGDWKIFGFYGFCDLTKADIFPLFELKSAIFSLTNMSMLLKDKNDCEILIRFNDLGIVKQVELIDEYQPTTSTAKIKNCTIDITYTTASPI